MSRKIDPEQHICDSFALIQEYENIVRLSDRPKKSSVPGAR